MKKILKLIFTISLIIFIKLTFIFILNEIIILTYNNNIYSSFLVKGLYFFNFNQSYIAYYNEGNILYKKKNYDEAITKYNKAINNNPPQGKMCDVRINLSLAMIKNIKSKDYKTVYDKLEDAKGNLYNNNCASPIDDSGYSKNAEKLEEEIKKLQDQLNTNSKGNSKNNNSDDEDEDNGKDDYSEIEDELKEKEKEANANRHSDMLTYENMGDYSYYSGKSW